MAMKKIIITVETSEPQTERGQLLMSELQLGVENPKINNFFNSLGLPKFDEENPLTVLETYVIEFDEDQLLDSYKYVKELVASLPEKTRLCSWDMMDKPAYPKNEHVLFYKD